MMPWIVFLPLTVGVLILLLVPLLRRPAVMREADRQRRLIAALILLGGFPLATATLYSGLGHPDLKGHPIAERRDDPDYRMATLAEHLNEELVKRPNSHGYALLGGILRHMGRYDEAIEAYQHAIERGAVDAQTLSAFGEVLVFAGKGEVSPEAAQAFRLALTFSAREPRAHYYLALAQAQAGHLTEAMTQWRALEAETPSDAPWRPALEQRLTELAHRMKTDSAD